MSGTGAPPGGGAIVTLCRDILSDRAAAAAGVVTREREKQFESDCFETLLHKCIYLFFIYPEEKKKKIHTFPLIDTSSKWLHFELTIQSVGQCVAVTWAFITGSMVPLDLLRPAYRSSSEQHYQYLIINFLRRHMVNY